MPQRPHKPAPVVVKRPPEQRRKLHPDLEAFARSDEEKLRIRRPRVDRGVIRDPREGYTVAGVANRDARAVYDVRSVAMRALWDDGAADEDALLELGQLFHDALRLQLWQARRLTSFAAFAEEVIGVPVERAEQLAEQAAERSGDPVTPLTEVATALWLRTEAGLYEGDERARARVRSGARGLVLELVVDLNEASTALAGVGSRHLPLARPREERNEPRDPEPRARGSHDDDAQRDVNVEAVDAGEPGGFGPREVRGEAREPDDGDVPFPAADEGMREEDMLELAAPQVAEEPAAQGSPAPGGARLLTRKRQDGDAPWGRREAREHEPPRGQQRDERPHFADRRGESQDRDGGSRNDRPRHDRNDRPRDERPRLGDRPKFGEREGRGFQQPRQGGGPRRFGEREGGFRRNDAGGHGNEREGGFRRNDAGGHGNERGGFHGNATGGFQRNAGGFQRGGGSNRNEGGFNRSEGGFNRNEGGFNRNEGGFNRNEGGFNRSEGRGNRDAGFQRNDRGPSRDRSRDAPRDRGAKPQGGHQGKPRGQKHGKRAGGQGVAGFGARNEHNENTLRSSHNRDDDNEN